jgi:hypothetical protein
MNKTRFAWCFSHGAMHRFPAGDKPWCTAAWIAFTATTETDAVEAKQAAYGDARFLNELPGEQQLEVIEAGEARRAAESVKSALADLFLRLGPPPATHRDEDR